MFSFLPPIHNVFSLAHPYAPNHSPQIPLLVLKSFIMKFISLVKLAQMQFLLTRFTNYILLYFLFFFFYFNTLHFIKSAFTSQKFDNSNSGADINVDMIDNPFLTVQQFLYQACFYNKKVPIGFS